jgi:hypothetical protein
VREAHPIDNKNDRHAQQGPKVARAKTIDDRVIAATECVADLKLSMPVLIDDMEATTETAYQGWPARLVIVDVEGRIAWRTRAGRDGADPGGAGAQLDRLLAAPAGKP